MIVAPQPGSGRPLLARLANFAQPRDNRRHDYSDDCEHNPGSRRP